MFDQNYFSVSTLLQSFERFIKKERLFKPNDNLLVAVSGGVDSVVLVHLLKKAGYTPAIAHCNFQLRSEASDEDAVFVEKLGQSLKLKVHFKTFETKTYASTHQVSTQLAARNMRYTWFEELLSTNPYDYLLTAHHANDQTETMLYNLIKGTGIAGLRGIPLKTQQIVRPLLFAKREEIESYAQENNLVWREDTSNQEDKYSRNHIRLNVIPELKKINPGIEQTMLHNNKRFDALEKLLLRETAIIKKQHLTQSNDTYSLALDWYQESNGGLAVLIELLKPFGLNMDQCLSIDTAIRSESVGKQFFSTQFTVATDRNKLKIVPHKEEKSFIIKLDKYDRLVSTPYADFTFEFGPKPDSWPQDKTIAHLDADLIEYPLKIRNWEQGDSFYPLGMKGKKKLSDFMIDEKIPVNLKSRVMLFESGDDIVWLAGYRIDDRYKVTTKTKNVLIIKMTDHV